MCVLKILSIKKKSLGNISINFLWENTKAIDYFDSYFYISLKSTWYQFFFKMIY